jgi:hypothetical protein
MIKRLLARKSLAAWRIEHIAVLANDFHLSSPARRPEQAIRRRYAETGLMRDQPPSDSACSPPNLEGEVFVVY